MQPELVLIPFLLRMDTDSEYILHQSGIAIGTQLTKNIDCLDIELLKPILIQVTWVLDCFSGSGNLQ